MTKSELLKILAQHLAEELSPQQIGSAVQEILKTITTSLSQGKPVEIRGMGTFSRRYWGPRYARNPYTKKYWMTQPRNVIHFKPGHHLKNIVNGIH